MVIIQEKANKQKLENLSLSEDSGKCRHGSPPFQMTQSNWWNVNEMKWRELERNEMKMGFGSEAWHWQRASRAVPTTMNGENY